MMRADPARGVLLVGNFLSSRLGTRGVCEDLADRLRGRGWEVIATSDRPGRLGRLIDMTATTWAQRRRYGVALVDVYSGPAYVWAEAVCHTLRWAGKPYVLTLHGGNLPVFARRWTGRVRRLLLSASAVTAPSPYLLESMRDFRSDLRLLPNPLDLQAYAFRPRESPAPRLLWLRAFRHIYNPTLAVGVLARLKDEFPDASLTMIGPDREDGSLEGCRRLGAALGVSDRVALSGPIPRSSVPGSLAGGDIFLNTTNVDNTPVSVLEAMAAGLCIVSTAVGGIPALLEHERDALLVPPDDAAAMADAVRRLLTEPGLAGRLSRAARAKAERVDWSVILPQWESLLGAVSAGVR